MFPSMNALQIARALSKHPTKDADWQVMVNIFANRMFELDSPQWREYSFSLVNSLKTQFIDLCWGSEV